MIRNSLLRGLLGAFLVATVAFAGDLEDGQALRDAGKFEEALPLLRKAHEADPSNADAAYALADVLLGLGRYSDAPGALKEALKAHEDDARLQVIRARAWLLMADEGDRNGESSGVIIGHVAEADAALKAALKADPNSADARVLRAKVYRYQGGGSSDESTNLLLAVIADTPDHFDAHWDLATHYQNQARAKQDDPAGQEFWKKAEDHFTRCSDIDPNSGMAILNATYAKAWQRASGTELAPGYEKAAKLLPNNQKVLSQLYGAFSRDPAGRVAAFERVEKVRSDDAKVLLFLAFAHKDAGEPKKGLSVLDRAEKLAPEDPYLPFNRGHILLAEGEIDDAVDAYTAAVEACGDTFQRAIYDPLNATTFQNSSLTVAQRERLWTALWKKWPDNFMAPNNAALWHRESSRDYKQSSIWYLRAVEAAPVSPQVLNDTALIFDQYLNDPVMAEPYYIRAIEAGKAQGRNWAGGDLEDDGYRDAINNMATMLAKLKRWKDLASFVEERVPEDHVRRGVWAKMAENEG